MHLVFTVSIGGVYTVAHGNTMYGVFQGCFACVHEKCGFRVGFHGDSAVIVLILV